MRTLADSSVSLSLTSMCSPEFFKQNEQAALAKIKGGDFAGGGTDAKINAQEIAVCSVKRQKLPMDLAEQIAGQNLAESAIALHRAGMDTPETITSAQNALTLLSVNASANTALIKQLKASGILPEKPAEAADTAAVTMSAVTVTKKYMANSFAFNQQYNGKTLQIRGKIHSVGGNSNSVFIILAGVPQEDPGMNDQVDCNI
ncbi:hypothetical protein, partial [Ferrovum myxofaciens]|uniref:hypothetical protein n=1 Tax=Ferrovum myxofaciens TaxID=416213 RepID=UPI0005570762